MLRQRRLIRLVVLLAMAGLSMLSIYAQASYTPDNQLKAYGQTSYRYDANGNTIERIDLTNGQLRKTDYRYNAEQRLIQVSQALATAQSLNLSDAELQAKTAEQLQTLAETLSPETIASYHYNPYGQRIRKTVSEGTNTHTTYYLYSEQGLAAEYADNGQVMVEYHYRPDSPWMTNPITQKRNGQVYYYQNDALGTPERVLENTGRVMWEATHTAFGETTVSTELVENNLRFPGQYYDKETSTHYNYHRDYDPNLGRYLQRDPIGLDGGVNTYGYAYQNPLLYTDSQGLTPTPDTIIDLSFIAYDVYRLGKDNLIGDCDNLGTNMTALGADIVSLALPGVFGLGKAVRETAADVGRAGVVGESVPKGLADPSKIRFSQDSIRGTFRDGRSVDDLVKGLKDGSIKPGDVPAIRTVERDGQLISIDNRRLAAFKEAGVPIRTRPATASEIAQAEKQGKFSAGASGSDTIRIRGQ